jgi:membrane associated rhomboid family serine protease
MATEIQTCYRHSDRRAGVSCQRCDRPICPSCMISASVGFHCPECARKGRQKVITPRTMHRRPIVTQVLIGINALVYVLGVVAVSSDALAGRGGYAIDGGLLGVFVANGDWWRIITAGFLHAGLMHLGFNMLALWVLGGQLEPVLGRLEFAVVYFTSLLAGSFGVLLLSPNALTVGASGAVFGLMGATVALSSSRGISIWNSGIGGLLMINLFITFLVPGISIGGHLGGLAGGFVAGWLIVAGGRMNRAWGGLAAAALVGVACFAGALYLAENPLV